MVKLSVTVKGDPATSYQILTDFSKYMEWYPECMKCDALSSNGNTTDVDMTLGGLKIARMLLRYEGQPNTSVTYVMVSSNDLKDFGGSYKIVDNGDGTHVVHMQVDLSAGVPKFVTDRMLKSSLEKQAAQLQIRNARFGGAPAPPAAAQAASAPVEARPVSAKARRPRSLLRVEKSGEGVRIWYAGAEYRKND